MTDQPNDYRPTLVQNEHCLGRLGRAIRLHKGRGSIYRLTDSFQGNYMSTLERDWLMVIKTVSSHRIMIMGHQNSFFPPSPSTCSIICRHTNCHGNRQDSFPSHDTFVLISYITRYICKELLGRTKLLHRTYVHTRFSRLSFPKGGAIDMVTRQHGNVMHLGGSMTVVGGRMYSATGVVLGVEVSSRTDGVYHYLNCRRANTLLSSPFYPVWWLYRPLSPTTVLAYIRRYIAVPYRYRS